MHAWPEVGQKQKFVAAIRGAWNMSVDTKAIYRPAIKYDLSLITQQTLGVIVLCCPFAFEADQIARAIQMKSVRMRTTMLIPRRVTISTGWNSWHSVGGQWTVI